MIPPHLKIIMSAILALIILGIVILFLLFTRAAADEDKFSEIKHTKEYDDMNKKAKEMIFFKEQPEVVVQPDSPADTQKYYISLSGEFFFTGKEVPDEPVIPVLYFNYRAYPPFADNNDKIELTRSNSINVGDLLMFKLDPILDKSTTPPKFTLGLEYNIETFAPCPIKQFDINCIKALEKKNSIPQDCREFTGTLHEDQSIIFRNHIITVSKIYKNILTRKCHINIKAMCKKESQPEYFQECSQDNPCETTFVLCETPVDVTIKSLKKNVKPVDCEKETANIHVKIHESSDGSSAEDSWMNAGQIYIGFWKYSSDTNAPKCWKRNMKDILESDCFDSWMGFYPININLRNYDNENNCQVV
jgi:hypothetical protein